ncbi:MAG: aminoacyl-tRNA hydrolase [Flavobacteriales bacterium]|nr:aminoacyl-tRNA hydrolase [Flavobacteriales bacterium]
MKVLIVGLGNPGPEYIGTRHNIGFSVLDALCGAFSTSFMPDRLADRAQFRHKGRTYVLIKPSTFMNLSGKAVRYWIAQEDLPLDQVLVVADDLALPFGKVRIRARGGAGGHNGLTSIIEVLGSEEFARLRFGIGNDYPRGRQSEYVLGPWSEEERLALPERAEVAGKAIVQFGLLGLAHTMNHFNNR